jgi:inner membrane transporter RhtA
VLKAGQPRPRSVAGGAGGAARAGGAGGASRANRLPPATYFVLSAVFHYVGPSLAVLLFARLDVLGVAWLRVVTAAVVFAAWRRPWRLIADLTWSQRRTVLLFGIVLAGMNVVFYLAVDRLPLATVSAIEFLGTIILAAAGTRTWRNVLALAVTVGGVAVLAEVRLSGQPLGFVFAFANCAGFMLYVILGHRIAIGRRPDRAPGSLAAIDQLGLAMLVAAVVITPIGGRAAGPAFGQPVLLLTGVAIGVCSSVIPYVLDQLAMARLPRATFALMLALLPAVATVVGLVVLRQVPTGQDLAGIGLVIAGIALHRGRETTGSSLRPASEGRPMAEHTETAIVSGGCFWPAQELLRRREGVVATRVGYTGGENASPTADDHPGHAEAVEVTFDPARTSYRAILEFWIQIHRPDLSEDVVGSGYRSEIFVANEEQRRIAGETIAAADATGMWPGPAVTKISPAGQFWPAEEEDQEYLRHYPAGKNQFRP